MYREASVPSAPRYSHPYRAFPLVLSRYLPFVLGFRPSSFRRVHLVLSFRYLRRHFADVHFILRI
jgi:hypothetical protein